jgi:hypothetical protein
MDDRRRIARDYQTHLNSQIEDLKLMNAQAMKVKRQKAPSKSASVGTKICKGTLILLLILMILFFLAVVSLFVYINFIKQPH